MNPTPTIGRIVLYCLSEQDVEAIQRRRTTGPDIARRLQDGSWPQGAQAHIGNDVAVGHVLPAMVVKVYSENCVNLKVMLDGTDTFWATSKQVSDEPTPGTFHWMGYQKQSMTHTVSP